MELGSGDVTIASFLRFFYFNRFFIPTGRSSIFHPRQKHQLGESVPGSAGILQQPRRLHRQLLDPGNDARRHFPAVPERADGPMMILSRRRRGCRSVMHRVMHRVPITPNKTHSAQSLLPISFMFTFNAFTSYSNDTRCGQIINLKEKQKTFNFHPKLTIKMFNGISRAYLYSYKGKIQ